MSRPANLTDVDPGIVAAAQAIHDLQHAYAQENDPPCDMCLEEAEDAVAAYRAVSIEDIANLLIDGLNTDGSHHKQWYLIQIAIKLGVLEQVGDFEPGVAP